MKFAIVVGHEAVSPGAKAVAPLNCYEYEYNKIFAVLLASALMEHSIQTEIIFRDHVGIIGAYKRVNEFKPLGSIELHFNAANGQARGTETLFATTQPKSGRLAYIMQSMMCQELERVGHLNRGWNIVTTENRGHVNLIQAKCPSIITEPFFGDNPQDATLGLVCKKNLALAMAEAIHDFTQEITRGH